MKVASDPNFPEEPIFQDFLGSRQFQSQMRQQLCGAFPGLATTRNRIYPAGRLTVQAVVPASGRATIKQVFVDGKPYAGAMKDSAIRR